MIRERRSAADRILFGRDTKLRLAERRKRKRLFFVLALLAAVLVAAGLVSWLSYHPRLAITEIRVEGVQVVSAREVRTHAESALDDGKWHFFSRRNIFAYPKEEIGSAVLASIPRIRGVDVGRTGVLDSVLLIAIEERTPVALWCEGAACYEMDETGFVFAESATSTDMVRLYGNLPGDGNPIGQYFLPERLQRVQDTLALLAERRPIALFVFDGFDYEIEFANDLRVKASFEQAPEVIAGNLDTAFSSEALRGREGDLEYIDLRFGNRVYFRFRE